jgi:peptide/nickel transport system substrate-binding protein
MVVLSLLFIVACGPTEQPAMSGTDAAKPADTQAKAQPPAAPAMTDKAVPTAVPQARSEPQQAKAKVDRVTIAVSPLGWDTNYAYKVTTSGLLDKRPVLEWLVDIDLDTGEYIPNLATSWEMAPNGKDWTFKLRQGVQFQAGPGNPAGWGEFTAKDVKHSLWLLVHPDSAASGLGNWRKMTGVVKGDDYPAVTAKIDEMVEIVDEYTVVIKNKTVQPEYLFFIGTRRNMPIESKARWDAVGHEGYGKAILGTGPLKFIERIEGVHVTYEALPDHWRKVPDYNELEFRWVAESATRLATLLTGEVHLSDLERAVRAEAVDRGMKTIRSTFPATQVRTFIGGQYYTEPEQMQPGEPLLNKTVRQAMNKAINRQAIVDAFLQGSDVQMRPLFGFHPQLDEAVWPGIINPDWEARYDEMYGYDPQRARELLVEAGYPNGLEFTVYICPLPGLPELVDIGQAMALDWEAIGLSPKMVNLEYSSIRKKYRAQNFHNAVWAARSATTSYYTALGFYTKSTTHHFYQHPEIDKRLEELDQTIENQERARLLREIGDQLYNDFGVINMFNISSEIMVNPKFIAGYKFPGLMSGFYTHLEYIETVPQ